MSENRNTLTSHPHSPSETDLQKAVAENHRLLFECNAISSGGKVYEAMGIRWTLPSKENTSMVLFPKLSPEFAGAALDSMMDFYRRKLPHAIGFWSLDPAEPEDLGPRLLARGFQTGWRPCWMSLELIKLNKRFDTPSGLSIQPDNRTVFKAHDQIPYSGSGGTNAASFAKYFPGTFQRFVASINGTLVGQSAVFFSGGPYGIAGIYDVGVHPAFRQKGIGKALISSACEFAMMRGYHWAVLNATGKRIYEQLGFKWLGYGLTWWMTNNRSLIQTPLPLQIEMTEAVGKGDLDWCRENHSKIPKGRWNERALNGMRYLEIAALYQQKPMVEWLMENGAECRVFDAWNLGWKEKAAELLRKDPGRVNQLYEETGVTLLHIAAERNDLELARLALQHGADLKLRDKIHDSTPLGWAEFFKREELIRMIGDSIR